ncbi:MAG TPA: hypothetical protein VK581_09135 [Chthoniobacterales bacterium]|nr:hypothetical protein [Chthoniobacterales bacterium]
MIVDLVFLLAFSAFWIAGEIHILPFAVMRDYGHWVWSGYCAGLFFAYPFLQRSDLTTASCRYALFFARVLITFGISFTAATLVSLWRHPDPEWSMGVWIMLLPALPGSVVLFVLGSVTHMLSTRHT